MSNTLIDSVKSVFTDVIITKFASLLGESENNTRKGLQAAISMVLTSVLTKGAFQADAAKVYELSKQAAGNDFFGHIHELSINQGGLTAGSALLSKGADYANALLGARTDNVIKEVGRHANVSVASASFITGVASFAALDAIGRHINSSSLDVKGMIDWLGLQRDSIIHAIPNGVHVKEALGISHYPGEKNAKAKRTTTLVIILVIIAVLVAAFFWYRAHNNSSAAAVDNTADTVVNTPAPAITSSGPAVTDTLPNGTMITADKGGTEERLIAFLKDPNAKIDSKNGNWVTLTKTTFDANSANLLLASETQLKNIVAILNAFPKAKIKIGGFTDNVGDASANTKLSQQRADNILAKLKDLGANHSQLDGAKGYGADKPIGDNGTEDGRAMNRRTAVDVVDK